MGRGTHRNSDPKQQDSSDPSLMHIGLAGQIDVTNFAPFVEGPERLRKGYAHPVTSQLGLEYLRQGHQLTVFATDAAIAEPYEVVGETVRVVVVPLRARARDRALDFWRSERDMLSARMRTSECDVLHAHWTYEFALSALVSGLPTLVTSHDWAPAVWQQHRDAYRTIRALMQLRVLRTAGALTAVSPYIQSRMARYAKAEVRLIPNGIHRLDRHEEIPNATGRIGAVNVGFDRKKNVGSLLRAFAHVRSINPAAELHLVGPEYETGGAANRWAAAEALAEGVTFQGPLPYDETLDFIRSVNLLVHPSLEESFGMVVLEAAASGTPVIAHTGALGPAWILEGAPECLVDCRSIQKLAAAISAGLAGEMNPSMPEHLRANVLSRFSIEASATQYLEALASLATGN